MEFSEAAHRTYFQSANGGFKTGRIRSVSSLMAIAVGDLPPDKVKIH